MPTITFDVPDDVDIPATDRAQDLGSEVRLAAALHWCSRGELSTSQAAQFAGLSYKEFLAAAASRNVDLFQVNIDEVKQELARG
jgi:predicted HTH domain antitoxin